MNAHTLTILTAITVASALAGCTSAYTRAIDASEQKLASGDYQGAEEALGSRIGEQADQAGHARISAIRAQIQKLKGESQAAADLKSAEEALQSKQYLAAREGYERVSEDQYSNDNQKRAASDGICLADAGEPSCPLETQYQDCSEASKRPGSACGPIVSRLEIQLRANYSSLIDAAIARGDGGEAGALLEKYEVLPNTPSGRESIWKEQIQRVRERQAQLEQRRQAELAEAAIARLERRYPEVRRLSKEQFEDLIIRAYTVESAPFFTDARVDGNTLRLVTPNFDIQTVFNSRATLAEINDYFVAWCRCDGQTHVIGEFSRSRVGLATVTLSVEDQHSYVTIGR